MIGHEAQKLLENAFTATLTKGELQILQAITRGAKNTDIAQSLHISPKTVATHQTNLMSKLKVHSTATLITLALREGLIEPLE